MSETFTKRPGTTDEGKDYEHLYIANLILMLILNEKIKNFFISSNDKNFGSFDDVVVEIEYYTQAVRETYALQLKHKESRKRTLGVSALAASRGDHSLEKYFLDYTKTERLQNSVTLILLVNSEAQIPDKIQLNFEKQEFVVRVSRTSGDTQFLTTSKGGCCYTFASTNRYKQFFDNFILFTGQAGVEEIRREILEGLKNLFVCDETVFKEYFNFITEWSMKKGRKVKLDKTMMKRVITMCVLSAHIKPLSFSSSPVGKRRDIFRRAISKLNMTVLKEDSYEKIKRLWEDVVCDLDFENVNNVISKYQLILEKINKIEDLCLDNKEISKLLWLLEKCPLIVTESQQTSKATDFSGDAKFILLYPDVKSISRSCQNLSDLKMEEDIYAEFLDHFTYSLENQKEAPLRNLREVCAADINQMITVDDLLEMVDASFIIGKEKEVMPPCHVSRTVSKIVIKSELLEEASKDTLVIITCVKDVHHFKELFTNIQMTFVDDMVEKRIDNPGIYVTTMEKIQLHIELDSTRNFKYHQLRFLNNERLEWITSSSGIDDLKKFHLQLTDYATDERQLYDNYSDNLVNIFCANPGMGKSTLMKSLKKNSSSKVWTILLNARNHALHFGKHGNDVDEFLRYILSANCKENDKIFEKRIFKNFMELKKIQIVWDGLDEVSDDNLPIILNAIEEVSKRNIKQWITSRNNLKDMLEKRFHAFSREIREFNKEEQKRYIKDRLDLSDEDLSEIFDKIRTNIQLFGNNDILGIPLQIYMLTELFHRDKSKLNLLNNFFTIVDLYEHFINEKFNIYYRDKMKQDLNIEGINQKFKEDRRHQLNCYKNVAFNLHFPQNFCKKIIYQISNKSTKAFLKKMKTNTDSIGLITGVTKNNIPEFSHNSYGEYFAALYLSENYERKVRNKKYIFDEKYKSIRFFLDLILSKNCKGHIAVMYRNWKLLGECTDVDLNLHDEANRDILEIACNWNRESFFPEFLHISNDFQRFCSKLEDYNEVLEKLRYEDILQHFSKINVGLHNLNLKKLMFLFPNLIALYTGVFLNTGSKRFFVSTLLYYGIKIDCLLVFNCLEDIPWMQLEFECLELESILKCALDFESVDIVHVLISKYRCENIIIKNMELVMRLCCDKFSFFFDEIIKGKYNTTKLMHHACLYRPSKYAQFLMDRGAKVDVVDQNGLMPLHYACKNRGYCPTEIMQLLIDNGAKVDVADQNGLVPLHYACGNDSCHSTKIVRLLINNGANVDVADQNGLLPIHYACRNWTSNSTEIVRLLIDNGAKVDVADQGGLAPMHYACINDGSVSVKIVQLLIGNSAKLDVADQNGLVPMHYACRYLTSHSTEIVRLLIDNGANVDVADKNGLVPLHYACRNGDSYSTEIVRLLIDNGANLDVADQNGLVSMHYACGNGDSYSTEIVRLLIDNGASVDVADQNGLMPMHYACRHTGDYSAKIIRLLIDNGVNVDVAGQNGLVPMHYVCRRTGNYSAKILKLLIDNGANVDVAGHNGLVPMHYVCRRTDDYSSKIVRLLIDNGAKIDVVDQNGLMPIHYVCRNRGSHSTEIIQLLIANGAKVDVADTNGLVLPMHYACGNEGNDSPAIVQILIDNCAKVDVADQNGLVPLHYVCRNRGFFSSVIAQLLIDNGAKVDVADQNGLMPLHYACINDGSASIKIVQLLIGNGAKVDVADQNGLVPMHYACRNEVYNSTKIVRLLIDNGANVDVPDQNGLMPVHYACRNRGSHAPEIVRLLISNGANNMYVADQNG